MSIAILLVVLGAGLGGSRILLLGCGSLVRGGCSGLLVPFLGSSRSRVDGVAGSRRNEWKKIVMEERRIILIFERLLSKIDITMTTVRFFWDLL